MKPYILLKHDVHFFQINLNFLSVVEAGKSSVGAVEFAWRAISLTSIKRISSQVGAKKGC